MNSLFTVLLLLLLLQIISLIDANTAEVEFAGENCTLTDKGFYGKKLSAHEQAIETINYYYEVLYDQGGDFERIVYELDHLVGQKVLRSSSLFESCDMSTTTTRSVEVNDGELELFSISTRPHDEEAEKLCREEYDSAMKCAVIRGALTLFYNETSTDTAKMEEKVAEIMNIIKDTMQGDGLSDKIDGVDGVNYLDKHVFYGLVQKKDGATDGAPEGGTHSWKFAVGFVSVFGVLSILLVGLGVLKWKQVKAQEPIPQFNTSSDQNVNIT